MLIEPKSEKPKAAMATKAGWRKLLAFISAPLLALLLSLHAPHPTPFMGSEGRWEGLESYREMNGRQLLTRVAHKKN